MIPGTQALAPNTVDPSSSLQRHSPIFHLVRGLMSQSAGAAGMASPSHAALLPEITAASSAEDCSGVFRQRSASLPSPTAARGDAGEALAGIVDDVVTGCKDMLSR